jgi:hypothetical protein
VGWAAAEWAVATLGGFGGGHFGGGVVFPQAGGLRGGHFAGGFTGNHFHDGFGDNRGFHHSGGAIDLSVTTISGCSHRIPSMTAIAGPIDITGSGPRPTAGEL